MSDPMMMAGGWDYVIAAYTITTLVLAGYAWSLIRRLSAENDED